MNPWDRSVLQPAAASRTCRSGGDHVADTLIAVTHCWAMLTLGGYSAPRGGRVWRDVTGRATRV
jgi:hypothetical protein